MEDFLGNIQGPDDEIVEVPLVHFPEVQANYPGGFEALYHFIASEIRYPVRAKRINQEGKVFVQFVVEKDGSISGLEVVKGAHQDLNDEALRVMRLIPERFSPAKMAGRSVRTRMVIPITYRLNR